MTPEERQVDGPGAERLKDRVAEAIARAPRRAEATRRWPERLAEDTVDVTLPVRPSPLETGRIHPVSQVIDEITAIFADLGFAIAEGPDIETDYYNFTALNFPDGHPGPRNARHVLLPSEGGRRAASCCAPTPRRCRSAPWRRQKPPIRVIIPGPHVPLRLRPDPHADVPSGRGAGDRRGKPHRPPEVGAGGVLQGLLRGRPGEDALPPELLPVHRAVDGGRHQLPAAGQRDPLRRGRRLAGDSRLRHGAPQRHPRRRPRSRQVPGLRLGHGHRPHRHAEVRHAGPARLLRRRRALARPLRLPPARPAEPRPEG